MTSYSKLDGSFTTPKKVHRESFFVTRTLDAGSTKLTFPPLSVLSPFGIPNAVAMVGVEDFSFMFLYFAHLILNSLCCDVPVSD